MCRKFRCVSRAEEHDNTFVCVKYETKETWKEKDIARKRKRLEVVSNGRGNRKTRRKPTQTQGEHANSPQEDTVPIGIRTQDLLAERRDAIHSATVPPSKKK
ncbi:unnamed protein product [Knipowitschia caucasica]